jgi:hypothetical protein
LPGSSWSYYLGIAVGLLLVQSATAWIEGAIPAATFLPAQVFLAGAIAFILALFRYLNERAESALSNLRDALDAEGGVLDRLQYELTTLPAGRTVLASLLILAVVLLTEYAGETYRLESLDGFPTSAALLRGLYLAIWWIFGALLYHTVHQLRLINRIYTRFTRINLFQMKPLYAFSNLTAFTAGSLTVLPYGFLAANQISFQGELDPAAILLILGIQAIAVLTFLWPQLGIHQLQAAEKGRLMDEANRRLEATIQELHRRVDGGEHEKVGELNTTLAALQTELAALKGIPTWPWQPETVRWLITALVLPLGLWLIQSVLQRVLSP